MNPSRPKKIWIDLDNSPHVPFFHPIIEELDKAGYAVASGAACSSANPEPSATLLAMGVAPELARGAVRLSLGVQNTPQQVDAFLRALEGVLGRFKRLTAMAV